jgi:hypothetical protein
MGSHDAWRAFLAAGEYECVDNVQRKDGTVILIHAILVANVVPGLHASAIASAADHPPLATAV